MMEDASSRLNAALEGRYRIERQLGEGGMAVVYLAYDLKHERNVALKVLKGDFAAAVGAERFLAEIKTTANLQHPNLLPLFDSGAADGFLYYVMPYVEGESLRARLERERQLPVEDAVQIATNVAEALDYAHAQGVVHRDIKPANILLQRGKPLVADFGIALALGAASGGRLTETGLSVGTPHYMSPEQAVGDDQIGAASDIYALGCVLYETLSGEPPHTGGSLQAVLGKIITEPAPNLTKQRQSVPPNVAAAVARSLEKLPADRFPSAGDFAAALRDPGFRHDVGPSASATPARVRGLAWAGWIVALAAGAVAATSALSEGPGPAVRKLSLAVEYGQEPSEWLALTGDGSALVMAEERADPARYYVHGLDDLARIPQVTEGVAWDPAVSPDGRWVAFGGPTGLSVAPLGGGTARSLTSDNACCVRWGGDGYLYFNSATGMELGSVARVPETGGEAEILVTPDPGSAEGPIYYHPLPGGSHAILSVDADPDRIEIVEVETGGRAVLTEGVRPWPIDEEYLVFARDGTLFAAELDADGMRLAGPPVAVAEDVGMVNYDAMFSLSRSGDLVYWRVAADDDVSELVWVRRDGSTNRVDPSWSGDIESVELAPDGARAAITLGDVDRTEIWIKGLDDGPARRLTSEPGLNRRPVWAPDGRLVFISDRSGRRAVWAVSVDGVGTPELLFEDPERDVDEVGFSPDGAWLIYRTGTRPGDRDVFARTLGPNGREVVVAAEPGVDELSPTVSPDGRWLAYTSDRTGRLEIWIRPFPDVARGARQLSVDGGIEPVWSADGQELFYRGPQSMMSVEIPRDGSLLDGELSTLFDDSDFRAFVPHRAYDFDSAGERFLMIRPNASPPELILVQNFIEEVAAALER